MPHPDLKKPKAGQSSKTIAAPQEATVANRFTVFCGLNWASIVSATPFTVRHVSASAATEQKNLIPFPEDKRRKLENECSTLVAAQLPRSAVATTRSALQKAVPTTTIVKQPPSSFVNSEACYVATLWCLQFNTSYTVSVEVVEEDDGTADGQHETLSVSFTTRSYSIPLDLQEESPHILDGGSLLFHPELVECITAQGNFDVLFYLPPDPINARSALPFLHQFWYHGLFTLPEAIPLDPQHTFLFFCLPNGAERYVLDLAAATSCQDASEDVHNTPDHAAATLVEDDVAPRATKLFPWRQHSRVRRVIRSGAFVVTVREDAAGVMASLQRARDYHLVQKKTTWLDPSFIQLMGMCCSSSSDTLKAAVAANAGGARLVCVELLEKSTREVVAGCCGMAIGSVYHDYTMFTLRHTKDSLGNFLTKLIGEALQRCGYTLWYWGFRVAYMADYEQHFGAVNMPRDEFYRRWCAARDVAPQCTLEAFLKSGRAMVPYTTSTSSS